MRFGHDCHCSPRLPVLIGCDWGIVATPGGSPSTSEDGWASAPLGGEADPERLAQPSRRSLAASCAAHGTPGQSRTSHGLEWTSSELTSAALHKSTPVGHGKASSAGGGRSDVQAATEAEEEGATLSKEVRFLGTRVFPWSWIVTVDGGWKRRCSIFPDCRIGVPTPHLRRCLAQACPFSCKEPLDEECCLLRDTSSRQEVRGCHFAAPLRTAPRQTKQRRMSSATLPPSAPPIPLSLGHASL